LARDDALLLFDRETGLNVLCDGPEYLGLRQRCPRVVQFGLTNRCNLTCHFCSRDVAAPSEWTAASALDFLRDLADWGVLEVAFGGGEPLVFPGFADLVDRLHAETPLAVHLTTNGLRLGPAMLARLAGKVGQVRLSLYDDNNWRQRVRLLATSAVRFGVNYLVTPDRLLDVALVVLELVDLGCLDVLLLSYNGHDPTLHLRPEEVDRLDETVAHLAGALAGRARICVDVCWGSRLVRAPRLFEDGDCGAGRDFLVVTSDRRVMPCSFHQGARRIRSVGDLQRIWAETADSQAAAAMPGCARTADFGLSALGPVPVAFGARR
jgi:MoaA/NifB/PqqE/SkfB family radical SAM enzyme